MRRKRMLRNVSNASPLNNVLLLSIIVVVVAVATGDGGGSDVGGGIQTRVNVDEYMDLALDVREIRTYASSGQVDQVLGLYEEGSHAEYKAGFKWPLQKLSNDLAATAAVQQQSTPFYLFHLYGLAGPSATSISSGTGDVDALPKLVPHKDYMDEIVQEVVQENVMYADEAILAHNVWMYCIHLLYTGVLKCDQRTRADEPSMFDIGGGGLDEFIGLYIGSGQTHGQDNGNSLYSWVHTIGERFGTETDPEAVVNNRVKLLYQEGAALLSMPDSCSSTQTSDTPTHLWKIAAQISNEMMKPLYQWLLYHILENNSVGIRIYAEALIPKLSMCRPSLYKRLKEDLLDSDYDPSRAGQYIQDIVDSFHCFGFLCEDIGTYNNDDRLQCDTTKRSALTLAGYIPAKNVNAIARLDLDVHQIKTLYLLESSTFAKIMYRNGHNAPKLRQSENDPFDLLSLQGLATTSERETANPVYNYFVGYYNVKDYANQAVLNELDHSDNPNAVTAGTATSSKWSTRAQRAEVIAITGAFQIVYLYAIAKMNAAVKLCEEQDPDVGFASTLSPWDEAAALIIGSMEGQNFGGSSDLDDGQFLHNLANERAFEFGTLNSEQYANVNKEIVEDLYAGKGELDAVDCDNLQRTSKRIQDLMTVSLMQSTLHAASIIQSQQLTEGRLLSLAQGEAYALSVLPIINSHDPVTAEVIHENMIYMPNVQPVRDGAQEVADGFGYVFTQEMKVLDCPYYLGSTADAKPCQNHASSASRPTAKVVTVVTVFGIAMSAYILALIG